jgi:glycosyltransferase involved in cell wall biosynthesis
MSRQPSLFARLNRPYYILTPHYQQGSGGVRALHYLCHALNLLGEEAYVTNPSVNIELRTPVLTLDIGKAHDEAGREPIVIYAEVVTDNPLQARHVVHYLLADPSLHTGKQIQRQANDLVYTFGPTLVPPGWSADPLRMPLVDTKIFHSDGVDDAKRKGSAVFIHRHLDKGGKLDSVTAESIEISFRVPERSMQELAEIFRSVECLYLYEYSTICFEALLCGCPVVFIQNETSLTKTTPWLMGGHGIAWSLAPEALAHAKASVGGAKTFYEEEQRTFWRDLESFVTKTQAQADKLGGPTPHPGQPGSATAISARSLVHRPVLPAKKPVSEQVLPTGPRKRRLLICTIEAPTHACPQIRLVRPFSFFPDDWELVWGIVDGRLSGKDVLAADAILLHRFMPGICELDTLKAILSAGKPVIYETDDLLTEVPDGIPNAEYMRSGKEGIEFAIRHASALVVSTPFLADWYRPMNPNIYVLDNYLDFDRFYQRVPLKPGKKITLGMVGTSLMDYNFALVDSALRDLVKRYAGRIRFCFIGHRPPSGWEKHPAVEFHPVLHDYQDYVKWLLDKQLDIALVPLVNDTFNHSKTAIKWLEYAAAGVATVFSDSPVYRTVVENGRNGLLVGNSPDDWMTAIDSLVDNPAWRRQLARTAQAEVRKHFSLRENAVRYHRAYLQASGAEEQAQSISVDMQPERVPGILVLDGKADVTGVEHTLNELANSVQSGLPVIVLTTQSGDMPEWTDSLRYVKTTSTEYPGAVEQLCALDDFDWVSIIEAGQ